MCTFPLELRAVMPNQDTANSETLLGKQVIGVCNFPEKNIAVIVSEVLILGAIAKDGKVVLVHPSRKTENGLDIA